MTDFITRLTELAGPAVTKQLVAELGGQSVYLPVGQHPAITRRFIRQSGLSAGRLGCNATAPKTDTMRCVDACCALDCISSASHKYFDDTRANSSMTMSAIANAAKAPPSTETNTVSADSGHNATEKASTPPTTAANKRGQLRRRRLCLSVVLFLQSAILVLIMYLLP